MMMKETHPPGLLKIIVFSFTVVSAGIVPPVRQDGFVQFQEQQLTDYYPLTAGIEALILRGGGMTHA